MAVLYVCAKVMTEAAFSSEKCLRKQFMSSSFPSNWPINPDAFLVLWDSSSAISWNAMIQDLRSMLVYPMLSRETSEVRNWSGGVFGGCKTWFTRSRDLMQR